MAVTRTRNKIRFVQEVLSVFTAFRHSGKTYLDYLRQSKGGDEFDVREMIIKPLFRKLGYDETDFYNEVTIQAGEVDLNIGTARLQPVIIIETKATSVKDLKSARIDQLFPYMKELHTPIGIVTNGRFFEVWEQKAGMQLLVTIDFVPMVAEYLKGGINAISDDDFARILKLMYLKKEIRYISDEDLYAVPGIDIVEPTSFQNLLDDLAKMVEITRVDVEEQFNLHLQDHQIFKKKRDRLEGWQLDKLCREYKKSLQTIRYFHRWAELNNIDLEENQNGQEKFVTETMYILINRILLIRIAEDKGIIPRQISNGAIKDFKHFIGGVKVDYNRLLRIAYDTMLGVYEHFFKHDIFDWYIPDSELLLRLLFVFNKYNFGHVNRDILGNLYQKYIDKEERKRLGQFYTPNEVVQYILDGVGYSSDAEIENKTLLDPACGSGGFLVPAANRLIGRLRNKNYDPITILNKVRDNIYGLDINPFAAHLTETNLLFQVVDLISEAKKLDSSFRMEQFNVFVTDSLKIPEENQKGKNMSLFDNGLLNSAAVYDAEIVKDIKLKRGRFKEGVDFVVGNPPYISIKQISESNRKYLEELYETWNYRYDYFAVFIERGLKLLQDTGYLGFIVADRVLFNSTFTKLRKFILDYTVIKNIVHFGKKVFDDVVVDTSILILKKEKSHKKYKCTISLYDPITKDYLSEKIDKIIYESSPEFTFLIHTTQKSFELLEKIEKSSTPLQTFALINNGLRPGKIEFVKQEKQHELDKPLLFGKDIERYGTLKNSYFIEYDIAKINSTKAGAARDPKIFETCNKILVRQITGENHIISTLDFNSFYFDQTVNSVICIDTDLDWVRYVLAVLNSKLIFYWFKNKFNKVRETFPKILGLELRQIPIINRTFVKKNISELVEQILSCTQELDRIGLVHNNLRELIIDFKSKFPRYVELSLVPLSDIPGLKHIQLEKRLSKPEIRREDLRVFLAKSHYLDLATEPLAEYIELALKSMRDNLRGLTKPDILRMVRVPNDDKALRAILKYNSDLKKQKAELERQRDVIDQEIDERVYELYGMTDEDRRIIEENL